MLIEGAIMGLTRNLTLEKFQGIHKDDPSEEPKQLSRGCLNCPCPVVRLMTILNITIEPSARSYWKQKWRSSSGHWTEHPMSS